MSKRKKPSYTALLKEVRKLRKATLVAKVSTVDEDIAKITVNDDVLARIQTARILKCNRFELRTDYSVSTPNVFRITAQRWEDVRND